MNKLKKALTANAIFSSFSGIIMLVFHQALATLFGWSDSLPFLIIGVGLLFFATTIVIEIKKQRLKAIQWIIIQDLFWVVASVCLLVVQPIEMSFVGQMLVADVAIVVFIFAVLQYRGLGVITGSEVG